MTDKIPVVVNLVTSPQESISRISLRGEGGASINMVSEAEYTVVEGAGYFMVGGRVLPVGKGDRVLILPGTEFRDWSLGDSEMVMVSRYRPAFDEGQVRRLATAL